VIRDAGNGPGMMNIKIWGTFWEVGWLMEERPDAVHFLYVRLLVQLSAPLEKQGWVLDLQTYIGEG
jgi:hypothetical protein